MACWAKVLYPSMQRNSLFYICNGICLLEPLPRAFFMTSARRTTLQFFFGTRGNLVLVIQLHHFVVGDCRDSHPSKFGHLELCVWCETGKCAIIDQTRANLVCVQLNWQGRWKQGPRTMSKGRDGLSKLGSVASRAKASCTCSNCIFFGRYHLGTSANHVQTRV